MFERIKINVLQVTGLNRLTLRGQLWEVQLTQNKVMIRNHVPLPQMENNVLIAAYDNHIERMK
jgi:hypothetical protein